MTATYLDRITGVETSVAVKAPVLVATTTNITLSGEQTIDGIAVVAGDRVLVKNQTAAIDNGIWDASTGAWSRSEDFNGVRDAVQGTSVYVTSGSVAGPSVFRLVTASPVIGTSSLLFDQDILESTVKTERIAANAAALSTFLTDGQVGTMGGLFYRKDSTATGTDSATNDLGVDGLVPFGRVNLAHWGVVGDGVTDDAPKVQRAVTWCNDNKVRLHVSRGTYLLNSQVLYASTDASTEVYMMIRGEDDKGCIFLVDGAVNSDGAFKFTKNGFKIFGVIENLRFRAKGSSGDCGEALTFEGNRNGTFLDRAVYISNVFVETEDVTVTKTAGVNDILTPGYFSGGVATRYCGRVVYDQVVTNGPKQDNGDASPTRAQLDGVRFHDNSVNYLMAYGIDVIDCYDPRILPTCMTNQCVIGTTAGSLSVAVEGGRYDAQAVNVKTGTKIFREVGHVSGSEPQAICQPHHIAYRDYGIYVEGRTYIKLGHTLFFQQDSLAGTANHGPAEANAIYLESSNAITVNAATFRSNSSLATWVPVRHESVDATYNPADQGLLVTGCQFEGFMAAAVVSDTTKGIPTVTGCHIDRSYTVTADVDVSGTLYPIDVSPNRYRVDVTNVSLRFGGNSVGITYATRLGGYRVNDGLVTWYAHIVLTNKGTSTGAATINLGMPAPITSGQFSTNIAFSSSAGTQAAEGGLVGSTGVVALVYKTTNDNLSAILDDTHFGNTTEIRISGSYFIA